MPPPRWLQLLPIPNPNRQTLTLILLTSLLCLVSYLLGIYSNSLPKIPSPPPLPHSSLRCSSLPPTSPPSSDLHFLPSHSAEDLLPAIPQPRPPIPFCSPNFTDYSPCHDPNRERLFKTKNFFHRERHCPAQYEKPICRVPRPDGYRPRVPWPESRNRVWFANVPSKHLIEAKKDQHWVVLEGDYLVFPGGGTSFPHGVRKYAEELGRVLPQLRNGEIRTVLDIGCGVSFSLLVVVS